MIAMAACMPQAPLRVALLRCDTSPRYGMLVPAMFTQLLAGGLPQEKSSFEVTDYNVKEEAYPQDWSSVDAVVISGGGSSATDPDPWIQRLCEEIRGLHARKTRTLGVCFGHQIIAKALGGEVGKNPHGRIVGSREVRLSVDGQRAMRTAALALRLKFVHGDIVTRLPPGAANLGISRECGVHGMCLGEHILTLQAHPEFSTTAGDVSLSKIIAHTATTDQEAARQAEQSLAEAPHEGDAETIRGAITTFLREGLDTSVPKRQQIVGFGSLLSEASARGSFKSICNFRLARLRGFRRVFQHPAGVFFGRGIAKLETKEISSLSVEPCEGGEGFLVSTFDIGAEDVPAFYEREEEFFIVSAPVQELDGRDGGAGLLCLASTDAEYLAKHGRESFERLYGSNGLHSVWDYGEIYPCRIYCRHCVLAVTKAGQEVLDDFLDNTFLWDRKTTLRQHLDKDLSIMQELPPPELQTRYGG